MRILFAFLLLAVHPLLNEEALRVICSMPRWTPGKDLNRPVKVYFNAPVAFQLE